MSAGCGQEAGESLARLGDRSSVRLAALVTDQEDKKMVYRRQCLVECCLTGDITLANQLIKVKK